MGKEWEQYVRRVGNSLGLTQEEELRGLPPNPEEGRKTKAGQFCEKICMECLRQLTITQLNSYKKEYKNDATRQAHAEVSLSQFTHTQNKDVLLAAWVAWAGKSKIKFRKALFAKLEQAVKACTHQAP